MKKILLLFITFQAVASAQAWDSNQNIDNAIDTTGGIIANNVFARDTLATSGSLRVTDYAGIGVAPSVSYHLSLGGSQIVNGNLSFGNSSNTRVIEKLGMAGSNNNLNIACISASGYLSNINLQQANTGTTANKSMINIHDGSGAWNPVIVFTGEGNGTFAGNVTVGTIILGTEPATKTAGQAWANGDTLLWYDGSNVRFTIGAIR